MLRDAAREIRFHPGRFVATVIAIAISVGFMAASSVFVATETNALGRQQALPISTADAVVTLGDDPDGDPKDAVGVETVRRALRAVPGVTAAHQTGLTQVPLRGPDGALLVQFMTDPGEALRWTRLREGRWPAAGNEIVLTRSAATKLRLGIGGTLSDRLLAEPVTVVGLSADPGGAFLESAYVTPAFLAKNGMPASGAGQWVVKAAEGTTPAALAGSLRRAVTGLGADPLVQTGDQARRENLMSLTGDFDLLKYLLWGFAAIALVVGMIIIANTFTILVAQRRRQIGLLRAVGASSAQVRRRFLGEAVLLGAVGSGAGILLGIGIAAIGSAVTRSLFWGLRLPRLELGVAFMIGVAITVVAAFAPAVQATRVAPLEALRPVVSAEQRRRGTIIRAIVCGLLVAGGAGLATWSFTNPNAIALAVAGSVLITLGVLFGAPLFVPLLLRGIGALIGRLGATSRLATANSIRNPRRAAATATALMLAVGLIVTLQVATASARRTALTEIDKSYPIDLAVTATSAFEVRQGQQPKGIDGAVVQRLTEVPGVRDHAVLSGTSASIKTRTALLDHAPVLGFDPAVRGVSEYAPASLPAAVVLTSSSDYFTDGQPVTITGRSGSAKLTVQTSNLLGSGTFMVAPQVLTQLDASPTQDAVLWLSVPDRNQAIDALLAVTEITADPNLQLDGSVVMAGLLEKVLNILLLVTTALLGVAVVIAMIGVSNTLGLSVIERTRESALMRALGLQRGSLRLMLTVEAIMLSLAGVLVGVGAGVFFGWLGASAVFRQMSLDGTPMTPQFAVNLPQTAAILGFAVLAAGLASVLPGRRAATATPTEALADI